MYTHAYSGILLIWTPEIRTPLYSGHLLWSQMLHLHANYPQNQDTSIKWTSEMSRLESSTTNTQISTYKPTQPNTQPCCTCHAQGDVCYSTYQHWEY